MRTACRQFSSGLCGGRPRCRIVETQPLGFSDRALPTVGGLEQYDRCQVRRRDGIPVDRYFRRRGRAHIAEHNHAGTRAIVIGEPHAIPIGHLAIISATEDIGRIDRRAGRVWNQHGAIDRYGQARCIAMDAVPAEYRGRRSGHRDRIAGLCA